nr:hypothetical protein Iba_chr06aCG16180 [Ipomoea batatas]GMD06303.1 hypothetical protein Iba_chr06bCG14750 [Ipomoea batatas]GMD09620.1 hypothetical protein Iba_chr06dCG9940 [Ipomoea batatas]GME03064.1 hypothetical protein Iba_scaffold446CG0120 [Ipomoea batatas]
MSINKEFVKNSNLLLASRLLGMLAAESFTVKRRYNLLTCSFFSGSFGHCILENSRPSFLALANMFHVSSCSLRPGARRSCVTTSYSSYMALGAPLASSGKGTVTKSPVSAASFDNTFGSFVSVKAVKREPSERLLLISRYILSTLSLPSPSTREYKIFSIL